MHLRGGLHSGKFFSGTTGRCRTAIAMHAQLHFSKSFLCNAQVSVSFDYLPIFLYTGKSDWIVNVESKDNFEMVNGKRQFFLYPITT